MIVFADCEIRIAGYGVYKNTIRTAAVGRHTSLLRCVARMYVCDPAFFSRRGQILVILVFVVVNRKELVTIPNQRAYRISYTAAAVENFE